LIQYNKYILQNGLKVLIHEDHSTPLVGVSLLYNVGSKNENAQKTGLAHLFEHLMFTGSNHVPDFDKPVQKAGGENNAFTNSDITNYYITLPANNLEIAFWLESDRMKGLKLTKRSFNVQQKVVLEEFKETCLNEPYGDSWHHLYGMAYKSHPYQWPTIGIAPEHVAGIKLEDANDFYYHYYSPNNAILAVSGNVKDADVIKLAEKWFGQIETGPTVNRNLPAEPSQQEFRRMFHEAPVPLDAIYMAFHMGSRLSPGYYATDLLSDVLSNGNSSRFYQRLFKEKRLFSSIDAYITGSVDPGLLIIEGKPSEGVTREMAEAAIWTELDELTARPISAEELQKFKNKVESSLVFSEMSILNKAMSLSYYEMLGDASIMYEETAAYEAITVEELHAVAKEVLRKENCSTLWYIAKN
jgi:zinc protease